VQASTPQLQKKEPYLDVLRGLAILLVIAVHCISPYISKTAYYNSGTWWACLMANGIARAGTPLFFMLSGLLMLRNEKILDLKSFYLKQAKKIFLPLLLWNIIYCAMDVCYWHEAVTVKEFFVNLLAKGNAYHLWFMYQIFGIYLMAPFLKMILDRLNEKEQWVFLGVILLQPTLLNFLNTIQSYIHVKPFSALMEGYIGFFVLGYILGTQRFSRRRRWAVYGLGLMGYLINVLGNHAFTTPDRVNLVFNYGYSITRYLVAAGLFVGLRALFAADKSTLQNRLHKLFAPVAGASYGMYYVHVLVLEVSMGKIQRHLTLWPPAVIPLTFVSTVVLSFLLAWVIRKVPALNGALLGGKKKA